MSDKHWMDTVTEHMNKGGLHESLGIPKGEKIPLKLTRKMASKRGDSLVKKQAQLSLNMQGKDK